MSFNITRVDLERTTKLRNLYQILLDVNDHTPKNVKVFCTDEDRGVAYWPSRIATVPRYAFQAEVGLKWHPQSSGMIVIPKKIGYVLYYLAHELAHIHNFDDPSSDALYKNTDPHGHHFMKAFRLLCPEEYQHYEYEYKPNQAHDAEVSFIGAAARV